MIQKISNINFVKKGKGSAIILIHGWNCSHLFWKYNLEHLAQGYQAYALDLPGFGQSPLLAGDCSIKSYSKSIRNFMLSEGIEKATLVGHSMGGAIVLDFIKRYPDKVEKAVLVDTLIKNVPLIMRFLLIPLVNKVLFNISVKNHYYLKYFGRVLFYNRKVYDQEIINIIRSVNPIVSLRSLKSYSTTNFCESVKNIKVPVLIVCGSKTPLIMKTHANRLKKGIADSQLALIEKSKHIPLMENHEKFNQIVLDFLRSK